MRPHVQPVLWKDRLILLDQRLLPDRERYLTCRRVADVIVAIRTMAVRGAPLLGVTAAYGMVLAVREAKSISELDRLAERLAQARPTAVNLRWAVDRVRSKLRTLDESVALHEARAIHREDAQACERIGRFGAALIKPGSGVLTICNTGALATGGCGTAFSVLLHAKRPKVWVLETRPRRQGLLTMWEARKAKLDATLVADTVAGWLMKTGRVQAIVAGADRIAANGDTANKIGTYQIAVLAKAHGVPMYVAAPMSTFDPNTPDGAGIAIEERNSDEVAPGLPAYNPAFDVTPARLITAYITDAGLRSARTLAARSLTRSK